MTDFIDESGHRKTVSSDAPLPVAMVGAAQLSVKTAKDSFYDGFGVIDNAKWQQNIDASFSLSVDGNVAGAEYLKLTSSALVAGVEGSLQSLVPFLLPARVLFGWSASQRIAGEEHCLSLVSASNGIIESGAPDIPIVISSIRVLTNVAYISCSGSIANKVFPLDRVVLYGCAGSRLNVGSVVVTTVWNTENIIIIPLTIADGAYTVGADARLLRVHPAFKSLDASGLLLDGATSANAILYSKNAGGSPVINAATSLGTAYSDSLQASVQPYAYAQQPRFVTGFNVRQEHLEIVSQAIDSMALPIFLKRSQSTPSSDKEYVVHLSSKTLPNKSVPVARIVSVSKTGTTTATVTTDIPHKLTTEDWITAYGVTDTANFANLAVATVVASVINENSFAVVWGSAATAASFGGAVVRVNGGNLPAAQTFSLRGFARANGYMMLATSVAPVVAVGDTIRLLGVGDNVGFIGIDNRYKVAHLAPAIWYGNTSTSAVVTGITNTDLIPVGALVTGSGVPASAYIVSVQNGVGFTLSAATTTYRAHHALCMRLRRLFRWMVAAE